MTKLFQEVEKAEHPSRELSDRVLRALGWRTESHGFRNINGSTESVEIWLAPGETFSREDFQWVADEACMNMWSDEDRYRPHITDDFKAILAIRPSTVVWDLKGGWDDEPLGKMTYYGTARAYEQEYKATESKTPELAILSAFLKVMDL